jgi:drug/metabolite transporter (DMT)-like permease
MLGALLLGEPLQPLAVVGALICMGGVLWGTGLAPRLLVPASRSSP